jgi:hypothetical protein
MTTVNDGHTPTPWQIIDGAIYAPKSHLAPFTSREGVYHGDHINGLIALIYGGHNNEDSDRLGLAHGSRDANLAFIVEACNSHASSLATIEALRGALRAMTKYAEYYASDLHSEASERYTGATAARIISEANGIKKECEESRVLLADQPAKEDSQ